MSDTPGMTERMAADVDDLSDEWPDEWPTLRPVLSLPRLTRADLFDIYASVVEVAPTLVGSGDIADVEDNDRPRGNAGRPAWAAYARKRGVTVTDDMGRDAIRHAVDRARPVDVGQVGAMLRRTSQIMRVAAQAASALRLAAEDPDRFDEWAEAAPDIDVITALMRYAKGVQLPEASGSAS